jgi:hypothetical protein
LFGAHTDESFDTEAFTPLGLEDQDAPPEAFGLEQAMLIADGNEKYGYVYVLLASLEDTNTAKYRSSSP